MNCNLIEKHCPVFFFSLPICVSYSVICIRYFSNTKHKSAKKKILDNVFQSNCSSHAKLLTNLRKIEKRPKIRHRLFMHSALQLFVWPFRFHLHLYHATCMNDDHKMSNKCKCFACSLTSQLKLGLLGCTAPSFHYIIMVVSHQCGN